MEWLIVAMIMIPTFIWAYIGWDNADAKYAEFKGKQELKKAIAENNFKELNS